MSHRIRTYKGIAGFFIRFFLNLFLGKCFIPPILHCVKPKAPRAPRKKEENLSAPIPKDNKRKCAFNMALPQCHSKRRMPSFIGRLFICIRGKGKWTFFILQRFRRCGIVLSLPISKIGGIWIKAVQRKSSAMRRIEWLWGKIFYSNAVQ